VIYNLSFICPGNRGESVTDVNLVALLSMFSCTLVTVIEVHVTFCIGNPVATWFELCNR
jgi:hypothetical protein